MRQLFQTRIAAGQTWPGADGGVNLRPFRWVKVDNRGAAGNDLIVALNDNVGIDDGQSWYVKVPAGYQRIFNVTGPKGEESVTATEIHVKNLGAAAIPVLIELDTNPIVDQQRGQPGGATTGQTMDLTQIGGVALRDYSQSQEAAGMPLVPVVIVDANGNRNRAFLNADALGPGGSAGVAAASFGELFNGSNWDRARDIAAAGDGLGVAQGMQPSSTPTNNSPAVNTAATITYAAVAGQRHRLQRLSASYNAAPTGGNLLVQDGATTVSSEDITAAGPYPSPLPPGGILGSVNTAMTITLAAAGAAVTGRVNAAKLTA